MSYWEEQLKKRWKDRVLMFFLYSPILWFSWEFSKLAFLYALLVYVIVDEFIKEGYAFSFSDVVNGRVTHEKLAVMDVVLMLMIILRKVLKDRENKDSGRRE